MHILWLEDRPEMMRFDIETLKRETVHTYELVESPYEVMSRISSEAESFDKLIIDIMIPATPTIRIEGKILNTSKGFETGLVLYEHFLLKHYQNEVIFYTSRKITPSLVKRVKGWENSMLVQKQDLISVLIKHLNKV